MTRPRVAVSVGDPTGIGPEVVLKAVAQDSVRAACQPVLVGDLGHLQRTARECALDLTFAAEGKPGNEGIEVVDLANVPSELQRGHMSADGGEAAWTAIEAAVGLCLDGRAEVLVTAPIHKVALDLAGHGHDGHTEILQRLTGASWSQTVFVLGTLRILFYSRHLSLREAIAAIEPDRIAEALERFARASPRIGVKRPRIAVAGINPHAGEGGLFGREEIDLIAPGVELARTRGVDVVGPIPGDSVFHMARQGMFEAVLSFSHDQAAGIPKSIDFHGTVSVTLGLPFLRLSVDHGTALDIAGQNRADAQNMVNTLLLAARYARNPASPPNSATRKHG